MSPVLKRSMALAFVLAALASAPALVEAQGGGTLPTGGGHANPMMWTPQSGDSYVMPEVASRLGSLAGSFFSPAWLRPGHASPRLSAPRSLASAVREPRALRPSSRQ